MKPGRTILLVEDEPTLQRIFGSVLSDVGHQVEAVGTAEHALERLQNTAQPEIDLVLSDKNLPGKTGLDLLAETRRIEAASRRSIGFMLVTGYPSRDSALDVLSADGDGYLVKPFRSLMHAVEQVKGVVSLDLAARRAAGVLARRVARAVRGDDPGALAGVSVALLIDDKGTRDAVVDRLTAAGAGIAQARSVPDVSSQVLVAPRIEDLIAVGKARPGTSLVLLDAGASFQDIVGLIGAGGGALSDLGLLGAPR